MFNITVLLDVQANLPETSPYFVCPKMALVSSFFQMFIVLGMYNFDFKRSSCKKIIHFNCYLFLNISFQCSSFQFFIILAKFMYWLYFLCQFAWKVNIAGEFFFLLCLFSNNFFFLKIMLNNPQPCRIISVHNGWTGCFSCFFHVFQSTIKYTRFELRPLFYTYTN